MSFRRRSAELSTPSQELDDYTITEVRNGWETVVACLVQAFLPMQGGSEMRMHFASGGAAMFRQGIFGTMPCSRHGKSDSKHSRTRPSKLALCNTCNILQRYKSLYRVASPPKLLGEAAGRASGSWRLRRFAAERSLDFGSRRRC